MEHRKIAIPIAQGKMCAHFGHCEKFAVFEVNNGEITEEKHLVPPAHQPGVYPAWLNEMGVHDVIAGGIGQRAISLFNRQGVNVYAGAPLKEPSMLVKDLINGSLQAGENLCDH